MKITKLSIGSILIEIIWSVVALVGVISLWLLFVSIGEMGRVDPKTDQLFQPYIDQYIKKYGSLGSTETKSDTVKKPMKILVVSASKTERSAKPKDENEAGWGEVDSMYLELPEELRASTPKEVNTILKIKRYQEKVWEYTDGAPAYVIKIDASVIDTQNNSILKTQTFSGGAPPYSKVISSSKSGSDPDEKDVVKWIKSLAGINEE